VKIYVGNHTNTPLDVTVYVSYTGVLDADREERLKFEEMEILIYPAKKGEG